MDESTAPDERRGFFGALSRPMRAFIVADGALLLVFVVVLALFVSGGLGGSSDGTATAATDQRPLATSPAPTSATPSTTPASFALPSGNIACTITTDSATCTIASSIATPPVDATCKGVIGVKLTVTATGASTPCVEGAKPGKAAADTPVLDYGQSTTVGDFTCTSSSTGVKCTHVPSGKGFQLARAGSTLF